MRTLAGLILLLAAARADRAVSAYGEVFVGTMRVEGESLIITVEEEERRRARRDMLLVEKDDGTLVWAPNMSGRLLGYAALARELRREALAALLPAAVKSRDAAWARRVLEAAERDGFTGKQADRLKKKVEALERRKTKPVATMVAQVQAKFAAIGRTYADLLLDRARRDKEPLPLLRATLDAAPGHAEALAMVAERAPKDLADGERRFWLDFQVDLAARGARLGAEDRAFDHRVKNLWRPDLYCVGAGPIRLFTPVKETATIRRCLDYGRLTARALGEIFRTDTPQPRVAKWMVVFMYGDREEYLSTTGVGRRVENPEFLKWSLGYFSHKDQISRVFWHSDRDAERRIARVFVHELTHHWLTELSPRFSNRQLRRHPKMPGFWVVEGFATFMDEGNYDVDSMTWEPFDARAASLDFVQALSGTGLLIDWDRLYTMHQMAAQALPRDPNLRVVRRWAIGARHTALARLFYEQAAATCHFLYHADGGKYRSRLTDYVVAFYTSRKDRLAIDRAFGMSPKELGARVERFAVDVANGWRPGTK